MDAIIYTSNTGTTKEYAILFGKKFNLPVFSLKEAALPKGAKVIYFGWVMAGGIQGLKKASKKYSIQAVAGVGMGRTGTQIQELHQKNHIEENTPVFLLQGGFDLKKLHGIYHFMMSFMRKMAVKGLSKKENRTEEEDEMLDLMQNGRNLVSEENLTEMYHWFEEKNI